MSEDNSPQIGGQSLLPSSEPQIGGIPRPTNDPELSGQRPTCQRCGKMLTPAPVTLYANGIQLPPGCAWICTCDPSIVLTGDLYSIALAAGIQPSSYNAEGQPEYRVLISYITKVQD